MNSPPQVTPERAQLDAVFNAAIDQHEQGRVVEALEILQLLSLLDPRDQGVWRALARCHDDLGQPEVGGFLRSLGGQVGALEETS